MLSTVLVYTNKSYSSVGIVQLAQGETQAPSSGITYVTTNINVMVISITSFSYICIAISHWLFNRSVISLFLIGSLHPHFICLHFMNDSG